MGSVAVIGSYNLGITYQLSQLPVWGQTVASDGAIFSHGGKGSNQAVAAQRFGARTAFVGAVGQDSSGRAARAMPEGEGIDVEALITVDSAATGVGSIFLNADGANAIVIGAGANSSLTVDRIDGLAKKPWRTADVVLAQLEVPVDTVRHCCQQSRGICVVNPAPAYPGLASESWDWVDVLTPNETEARLIAGFGVGQEVEAVDLIEALVKKTGPQASIVVTLGEKGSMVWENARLWEVSAVPVAAVDSIGAGDTFNGILAAELARGQALIPASVLASAGASLSVQNLGVIEAIPRRADTLNLRARVTVQQRI